LKACLEAGEGIVFADLPLVEVLPDFVSLTTLRTAWVTDNTFMRVWKLPLLAAFPRMPQLRVIGKRVPGTAYCFVEDQTAPVLQLDCMAQDLRNLPHLNAFNALTQLGSIRLLNCQRLLLVKGDGITRLGSLEVRNTGNLTAHCDS
jgi:hypothetical protein